MKRLRVFLIILSLFWVRFPRVALAYEGEPVRVRDFGNYVGQALAVIWALTIPYFMFVVIRIGFEWMVAQGDEQKLAGIKKRGGNVIVSFVLVFGGWLAVKFIIGLLGLGHPGECFGGSVTSPFFQIFFPNLCT